MRRPVKVDDLVAALGIESGISTSEVSRSCAGLNTDVQAWRGCSLGEQRFPHVWGGRDVLPRPVGGDTRGNGSRVASWAVVIATGVRADGHREVLGSAVGDSEDEVFWTEFLRGRVQAGVPLVSSDSHAGSTKSIGKVMTGASGQRCRVHVMRNALARVPKGQAVWVAAAIRTVFAQPDAQMVRAQVETVAANLPPQLPQVAQLLRDARDELTAFAGFPPAHWRKIWSTKLRLASFVLMDAHDEWQVTGRR